MCHFGLAVLQIESLKLRISCFASFNYRNILFRIGSWCTQNFWLVLTQRTFKLRYLQSCQVLSKQTSLPAWCCTFSLSLDHLWLISCCVFLNLVINAKNYWLSADLWSWITLTSLCLHQAITTRWSELILISNFQWPRPSPSSPSTISRSGRSRWTPQRVRKYAEPSMR